MYTPRMDPFLVQRLYSVCRQLDIPMTQFVHQIMEPAIQHTEELLSEWPVEDVREQLALRQSVRRRKRAVSLAQAA